MGNDEVAFGSTLFDDALSYCSCLHLAQWAMEQDDEQSGADFLDAHYQDDRDAI